MSHALQPLEAEITEVIEVGLPGLPELLHNVTATRAYGRRWFQPLYAVSLPARLPGRRRWFTAWTRRGMLRQLQRHQTSRRRGAELAAQWLSDRPH